MTSKISKKIVLLFTHGKADDAASSALPRIRGRRLKRHPWTPCCSEAEIPPPGKLQHPRLLQHQGIREAQRSDFHVLVTIFPFANWDQMICHKDLPPVEGFGRGKGPGSTMGRPCNMKAYAAFVRALVERYDGDGQDDMPGLKFPIRHWEVGNEPSMQQKPLIFFQEI